jgi:hypothetical protein
MKTKEHTKLAIKAKHGNTQVNPKTRKGNEEMRAIKLIYPYLSNNDFF